MIEYIATRDRIPLEDARKIFRSLPVAELIRLELAVRDNRPRFESDFDPFAR